MGLGASEFSYKSLWRRKVATKPPPSGGGSLQHRLNGSHNERQRRVYLQLCFDLDTGRVDGRVVSAEKRPKIRKAHLPAMLRAEPYGDVPGPRGELASGVPENYGW